MSWEPRSLGKLICAVCKKPQEGIAQAFHVITARGVTFLRCHECEANSLRGIYNKQRILKSFEPRQGKMRKLNYRRVLDATKSGQ